jgi:hypothetical protein
VSQLTVSRIAFGETELAVLANGRGEGWLSVYEPCRHLGLDYAGQVRLIRERFSGSWREESVGAYPSLFLARDKVPQWLNLIRVADCRHPHCVTLLRFYQAECDQVLARHFAGPAGEAPTPSDPLDVALAQSRAIVLILERQRDTQGQVAVLERRVDALDVRSAAAAVSLAADGDEEAPAGLSLRAKLNRRVRTFAEGRQVDYADVWGLLYRDLRDRYRFDAQGRARHAGTVALDEVERAGMLPQLWRIACHKLK